MGINENGERKKKKQNRKKTKTFHGDFAPPMIMPTLTEQPWTVAELRHAISRGCHKWKCVALLANCTFQDASEDKGSAFLISFPAHGKSTCVVQTLCTLLVRTYGRLLR